MSCQRPHILSHNVSGLTLNCATHHPEEPWPHTSPKTKLPHSCTIAQTWINAFLSVCLSLRFLFYSTACHISFLFSNTDLHTRTMRLMRQMAGWAPWWERGGGVGCCDTSCHGSICAWAKAFWPLPLDFCSPFCGGKGNEGYVWWKGNVYAGLKLCYWRQKWRKRKNKCTNQVCGPSPKKREKRLNRGSERNPKEKLIRILFMEGRGTSCFPHRTLKWLYLL